MSTQIGSVIDGKYEILKKIGQGGMSVVYLAMDKRLNKQWAVKEIKRTANGRNDEVVINSLLAEANLMKRLDHPALPRIVDIIENYETIYVIMDYIEGESLDKILREYGAQPQDVVVEWAKQLCDALNYLHSQNPPIIYRDMKPANVMLKPEGNLKVIDFGIAREYKEQNQSDTTVLGTKGYAPPEQHGSRQTDPRSDIYALGMTMHHLLTGADPSAADYMYDSIRQWDATLSSGLERVIDKCTSLDPADRYQNCDELMYALEHYEEESEQYKKKQKSKLLKFVVSVALVVVFAILGGVFQLVKTNIDDNDYYRWVSSIGSPGAFEKALELRPYDITAYNASLDSMSTRESISTYRSKFIENLIEDEKLKYSTDEYIELAKDSGIAVLCSSVYEDDWVSAAGAAQVFFDCVKDEYKDWYNVCTRLSEEGSKNPIIEISYDEAVASCDNLYNDSNNRKFQDGILRIKNYIESSRTGGDN